jgi:hypothetical protein
MNLFLHVTSEYFDQIRDGEKSEEYRLVCPYWISRIAERKCPFDGIHVFRGFPKNNSWTSKNYIHFPWNGYEVKMIKHPHFGDHLVQVFAIRLQLSGGERNG